MPNPILMVCKRSAEKIRDSNIQIKGIIVAACAGDSKAILGMDGPGNETEVIEITGMHRATDIAEQQRLKADFAGKVDRKKKSVIQNY